MRPIVARRVLAAPREELHALLADLRTHWRLAGRWVEAVELATDGGVVRLHGPLGLSRTARTRVLENVPPSRLAGEAIVGGTRAAVSWTLAAHGAGTLVTLRADLAEVSTTDRALLLAGGHWWMQRRFAAILESLGKVGA